MVHHGYHRVGRQLIIAYTSHIIPLLPQQAQSTAYFIYNQVSSIPQISGVVPWAVAIIAGYLLLTTMLSTVRYAYRMFVFFSKIAAVVGVIASVMGASGQGGIGEVWNTVAPWLGLGNQGAANGGVANNLAAAANLFTGNGNNGGGEWWKNFIPSDTAPASSRTRSRTKRAYKPANGRYDPRGATEDTSNPIVDAINGAADSEYVQGWVKSALGKVWEQATAPTQQEEKKKSSWW